MRRIKAVASPSQLCLWDELDESAALRLEEAAPPAYGGGEARPAPAAPVAARSADAPSRSEGEMS